MLGCPCICLRYHRHPSSSVGSGGVLGTNYIETLASSWAIVIEILSTLRKKKYCSLPRKPSPTKKSNGILAL